MPDTPEIPGFNEPHWLPAGRFSSDELPGDVRPWVTDEGSLTDRLKALGRGEFRVRRLLQDWQMPLPSEQRLLGLPPGQLGLVREVALTLDDLPVVFARSVFPESSLTGSLAHLRTLENQSLGAILFSHPDMLRRPFELALMPGDSPYLPTDLQQAGPAWGRRSRFEIDSKALMVSEVFLECFAPWPALPAV
ncbi:MAG: chorismate lyase [Halioglobus sp.]|nr:chorismate lyase [Halioglobus sp.]